MVGMRCDRETGRRATQGSPPFIPASPAPTSTKPLPRRCCTIPTPESSFVFLPLFQVVDLRCPGDECCDVAGVEVGDASGTQVVELGGWFGVELVGYGTADGWCQGEAVTTIHPA